MVYLLEWTNIIRPTFNLYCVILEVRAGQLPPLTPTFNPVITRVLGISQRLRILNHFREIDYPNPLILLMSKFQIDPLEKAICRNVQFIGVFIDTLIYLYDSFLKS